ncbi:hypothetical protein MC885_019313, partial [Smutsia gigantea]
MEGEGRCIGESGALGVRNRQPGQHLACDCWQRVQDLSKAMSQDGASQFQEVIRQELELSVKKELEKILTTAPSHEFEVQRGSPSHAPSSSDSSALPQSAIGTLQGDVHVVPVTCHVNSGLCAPQ